jgi:hypothetical protein
MIGCPSSPVRNLRGDVELVKCLVEDIANDPSLMVDNDFGTVLPGDQFVAKCKEDEDWDWRITLK